MLYSQFKERSNRFKIALKIALPFFIVIVIYGILVNMYSFDEDEIVILACLAIVYIYYIFYFVYNSFKTTLLDRDTRTFNKESIISQLDKVLKSRKKNITVVMLRISNMNDIESLRGIKQADRILYKVALKLSTFLRGQHFKNIPIGHYRRGYFIILFKKDESHANHIFNIFKKNIGKIDDVETQIEFCLTSSKYDIKYQNIIDYLYDKLEKRATFSLMKPDQYDKVVLESIKNRKFIFKYQPIVDAKNEKIAIYEVLVKLHVEEFENLYFSDILSSVQRTSSENELYKNFFLALAEEVRSIEKIDFYFSVNFPIYIMKNVRFLKLIKKLIDEDKIKPNRYIFSFHENKKSDFFESFKELIEEYRALGFKIMLNHFGANNANIEYIKAMPIDYVSFDLDFSKKLNNKRSNTILKYFILMTKSLNITSIIKFIETKKDFKKVSDIGIDMVQGYIVSKPLKIDNIREQ